jgi:SAM-dependent methyltransferase
MRKCKLCGYEADNFKQVISRCRFNGEQLIRYQCPTCDVIFGNDRMLSLTPKEIEIEYTVKLKNYKVNTAVATKYELEFFNIVGMQKGKQYINWGAGIWSNAVVTLQKQGYDIIGYDPYRKTKITSIAGKKFDYIMTHNVLEHFQDPVKEIIEMKKYLKPGGIMAHATACYTYCYEWTRYHLFFFCGRSVNTLCELCGIEEMKNREVKTAAGQHIKMFKLL